MSECVDCGTTTKRDDGSCLLCAARAEWKEACVSAPSLPFPLEVIAKRLRDSLATVEPIEDAARISYDAPQPGTIYLYSSDEMEYVTVGDLKILLAYVTGGEL